MDPAKKAALEAARKDRLAWIELGAAQEREDLLEEIRAEMPNTKPGEFRRGVLTAMQEWLTARQMKSGVQVHRCTAGDMEPDGKEAKPEQTRPR